MGFRRRHSRAQAVSRWILVAMLFTALLSTAIPAAGATQLLQVDDGVTGAADLCPNEAGSPLLGGCPQHHQGSGWGPGDIDGDGFGDVPRFYRYPNDRSACLGVGVHAGSVEFRAGGAAGPQGLRT